MCPVTLPNKEKLAGWEKLVDGKTRRSFRYTLSLPHLVDMQQFNRCQMARSIL